MPRFTMSTRDAKRAVTVFWGHRSLHTQQNFRDALQHAQGRGLGEVYFVVHGGRVATAWAFNRHTLSNQIGNQADPGTMLAAGEKIEGNNVPLDMLLEVRDFENVVIADQKDFGDLIHIPSLTIPEGQEHGGGGPSRGEWAQHDESADGGGGGGSEEGKQEDPEDDPALGDSQEQNQGQQEQTRSQEERDRQRTEEENRQREADADARRAEEEARRQEELERGQREGEGRP